MQTTTTWALAPDGAAVVTVTGELGIGTVDDLHRAIAQALTQHQPHRVRIDVAAVTFCDSVGLSAFVGAYRTTTANGARLELVNPGPFLLRALKITGLLEFLTAPTRNDTP
jgi:anti-anti-sigma factor